MSWYVILNYEPLPEAVINYDSCRNSAQLVMPKSQADHFYTMERRATAHATDICSSFMHGTIKQVLVV